MCAMQGWRVDMEVRAREGLCPATMSKAHCHARAAVARVMLETRCIRDDLCNAPTPFVPWQDAHSMEFGIEGNAEASWFAVFDGHGGGYTSKYAAEKILGFITATPEWKADSSSPASIGAAMTRGFLTTDELLRAEPTIACGDDHSGSTAITAFITKTHIVVGNCGDSRAMLVRGNAVRCGARGPHAAAAARRTPPLPPSCSCCCCSLSSCRLTTSPTTRASSAASKPRGAP